MWEGTVLPIKQAVAAFCKECNGVEPRGKWEECVSRICPLFPYRPGNGTEGRAKRKKRVMSEEHKAKLRAARSVHQAH